MTAARPPSGKIVGTGIDSMHQQRKKKRFFKYCFLPAAVNGSHRSLYIQNKVSFGQVFIDWDSQPIRLTLIRAAYHKDNDRELFKLSSFADLLSGPFREVAL